MTKSGTKTESVDVIITVMSRLNRSTNFTYGSDLVSIPPRGRIEGLRKDLVGKLPSGLIAVQTN